jgi:death-on-curing protein
VLGAYFLELNGFDYVVKRFVKEMENIAVWVADNVIDKDLLLQIISSVLYEDDYPESIKLAIFEAIEAANQLSRGYKS